MKHYAIIALAISFLPFIAEGQTGTNYPTPSPLWSMVWTIVPTLIVIAVFIAVFRGMQARILKKQDAMNMTRRVVQLVSGLAVCAAFVFSFLWSNSFINRVTIYQNREKYVPETFLVTGAEFDRDEDGDTWWLKGKVAGREERLVPNLGHVPSLQGDASPGSAEHLLALYPIGTKIAVLYNPYATYLLNQGESLRVIVATPDFWEREAALRHRLGLWVLVPGPVMLIIDLTIRYLNRRHAKSHIQPRSGLALI